MKKTDILTLPEQGYDHPAAWHGPNLLTALQDVDVNEALWRPDDGRHCIWDLALHAAYWKWRVRKRITGERARFPRRHGFPGTAGEP